MASSEESFKLAIIMLLSAVGLAIFIWRRYGSVWKTLLGRLGPYWPRFIAIASVATLGLWILFWVLVGPEQRAELKRTFEETAPWVLRDAP